MTRQPLQFNLDSAPAKAKAGRAPKATDESKKQVGARISADLYRKLKARAALDGKAVQVVLEEAVAQYLA